MGHSSRSDGTLVRRSLAVALGLWRHAGRHLTGDPRLMRAFPDDVREGAKRHHSAKEHAEE